jgi:hypothetical protein
MSIEVIALSGKAGSGKDYVFENYLRPQGYHRWALADHFKIWTIGKGQATYEEVFHTKPPHVRKALQISGTEEGRNVYGEDIWLDTAATWMEHLSKTWNVNKFCVTDCRFPNEVEYIQTRLGGKVIRIVAPTRSENNSLTPEARLHISETALDSYTNFDFIVNNEPGQDVDTQVRLVLNQTPGGYFDFRNVYEEEFGI